MADHSAQGQWNVQAELFVHLLISRNFGCPLDLEERLHLFHHVRFETEVHLAAAVPLVNSPLSWMGEIVPWKPEEELGVESSAPETMASLILYWLV